MISLKKAVVNLYKRTRQFNSLAGGEVTDSSRIPMQKVMVQEEVKEMILGFLEKDKVEQVDGLIDGLVTVSELVMLLDGNEGLLCDWPYTLNDDNKNINTLVGEALTYLLEENWVDLLGILEDMLTVIHGDTEYNLDNIGLSNLSKFPLVTDVPFPEEVCQRIIAEGRYTEVSYYKKTNTLGLGVYVFMAGYDLIAEKAFPSPKIVKPVGYFIAPSLKV